MIVVIRQLMLLLLVVVLRLLLIQHYQLHHQILIQFLHRLLYHQHTLITVLLQGLLKQLLITDGFLELLLMECHHVSTVNLTLVVQLPLNIFKGILVVLEDTLRSTVKQDFLYSQVILHLECLVTFVVKQLLVSVLILLLMDYIILVVIVLPVLQGKKLEMVYSLHSLVVLSLLLGILKRSNFYSPSLVGIQILSSLMEHSLEMVYSLTSQVEKREEHTLTLDLVPYSHSINLKRQ